MPTLDHKSSSIMEKEKTVCTKFLRGSRVHVFTFCTVDRKEKPRIVRQSISILV